MKLNIPVAIKALTSEVAFPKGENQTSKLLTTRVEAPATTHTITILEAQAPRTNYPLGSPKEVLKITFSPNSALLIVYCTQLCKYLDSVALRSYTYFVKKALYPDP
jgi:hypothetical protein